MSATTPKKKKFTRKVAKRYEFVTFTTDIYEEPFTFPKQGHMTQKLALAIDSGRFGEFYEWLREAGVEETEIDAFSELDSEETQNFMRAWAAGDPVSLPKS